MTADIYQGDDASIALTVYDATGAVYDLADHPGAILWATLVGSGLEWSTADGDLPRLEGASRLLTLTQAQTAALARVSYPIVLKLRDPDGLEQTIPVANLLPRVLPSPLAHH